MMINQKALQKAVDSDFLPAIRTAAELWADATTNATTSRRTDLIRDKRQVVYTFFAANGKHPAEVKTFDIKDWQAEMKRRNLASSTIYIRTCLLSSFYVWAMKNSSLGNHLASNPVSLARTKKPRAYQTQSTKSLTDDELRKLLAIVKEKAADANNIVAKRDYALLQWYLQTGRRRAEVMSLRGRDVQVKEDMLIVRYKIKGGRYIARELRDRIVRDALFDYLASGKREDVLKTNFSLWTRHDRAGRSGAELTSHAFVKNLKRYAAAAGLDHIHLHMTRHTFARLVAEETGSLMETQEALDHEDQATTRIYVESISIKRDKHSEHISNRLNR